MANTTNINLVNLDFSSLKDNFKDYLKAQGSFKDYDFEGSNINVLLDILAYNTYMNAFYLNMVGNEMFLDSAQLRESVISRAKELNYVPRSFKSSRANVEITISTVTSNEDTAPVTFISIPKGTTFTSRVGSNTFTFSTDKTILTTSLKSTPVGSSNTRYDYTTGEITIYEGQYVTDTFNVNYSNPIQRFILSNPTIDTDSLSVIILENNGADVYTYLRATSLFGKGANSNIYFVQGCEGEKYEILFGDGVIGRKPADNAVVVCEYRATKGELPNGCSVFRADGAIGTFSNVSVNTLYAASQGSVNESLESIKFNAPRYFTTQERAVTAEDYENLLKINFPEINAVSVFGGEELDPPQFGKVYIAVDLKNVDGVPDIRKEQYYNFIKPRASLSIDPIFIDPDFMYLDVETVVRYNINLTALSEESIKDLVLNTIRAFNTNNIDDFNVKFRYSNLVTSIDSTDRSIISNDTVVRAIRSLTPQLGIETDYSIDFQQALEDDFADLQKTHPANYLSAVSSSPFLSNGKVVILEDDGLGTLKLKADSGVEHTDVSDIGSVDYESGRIIINKLKIDSFTGEFVKIYARTKSKDILSELRTILSIRDQDIRITVVPERE